MLSHHLLNRQVFLNIFLNIFYISILHIALAIIRI